MSPIRRSLHGVVLLLALYTTGHEFDPGFSPIFQMRIETEVLSPYDLSCWGDIIT